jgi:hypothetical protein
MTVAAFHRGRGTELGLQAALPTLPLVVQPLDAPRASFRTHSERDSARVRGGESVLVGAKDRARRAGVADRTGRLEIAQRDRDDPIREEALDVVDRVGPVLDRDHAPKGAAPDVRFQRRRGCVCGFGRGVR